MVWWLGFYLFDFGFPAVMSDSPSPAAETETRLLPVPKILGRPSLHVLGSAKWVAASLSASGFEQSEKTCARCGAVRVTMIEAPTPRAWRRSETGPQIVTDSEPPCGAEGEWP